MNELITTPSWKKKELKVYILSPIDIKNKLTYELWDEVITQYISISPIKLPKFPKFFSLYFHRTHIYNELMCLPLLRIKKNPKCLTFLSVITPKVYDIKFYENKEIKNFIEKYKNNSGFEKFIYGKEEDLVISYKIKGKRKVKIKITVPYYVIREPIVSYIIQKNIKLPKYEPKLRFVEDEYFTYYGRHKKIKYFSTCLDENIILDIPSGLKSYTIEKIKEDEDVLIKIRINNITEMVEDSEGNYKESIYENNIQIIEYRKLSRNEDYRNDLIESFEKIGNEEIPFDEYIGNWAKRLLKQTSRMI